MLVNKICKYNLIVETEANIKASVLSNMPLSHLIDREHIRIEEMAFFEIQNWRMYKICSF